MDALPALKPADFLDKLTAPATKRNKLDSFGIEFREIGIRREPRIEYQLRQDSPPNFFPERQEIERTIVGFRPTDVGIGVQHELGGRILGDKCQSAFHPLSPGAGPVRLQHRFISIMWNRVKIQIDEFPVVETELDSSFHKGGL